MQLELFEEVAEALRGVLPPDVGTWQCRAHRYGIKVWFGREMPAREHYEAQVIGARHVAEAEVMAIEVGFHAEHPKPGDNEAVIARLLGVEKKWRKALGRDAVAGAFLGRDGWARISETWADPDLGDPDLASELALRLAAYVTALEPLRS